MKKMSMENIKVLVHENTGNSSMVLKIIGITAAMHPCSVWQTENSFSIILLKMSGMLEKKSGRYEKTDTQEKYQRISTMFSD